MIPDFQSLMKPVLEILFKSQEPIKMLDLETEICKKFNISEEQRKEMLESGNQTIISNRVGWARSYLKMAGLVLTPKRGYAQITEAGKKEIEKNPDFINIKYLKQIPEFVEHMNDKWNQKNKKDTQKQEEVEKETLSPNELIDRGIQLIHENLKKELLEKIENNTPDFFEHLVLNLLSEMGYGTGKVTGQSGDGGIDGFISQDALGIDKIYFQAKRFTGNTKVSASMVRDFVGSLELKGVSKGVFITSSDFPSGTESLLQGTHKSIILINQDKLLTLMVKYNIGVSVEETYKIKKIDSDYFPED